MSFEDLGLAQPIMRAVISEGYSTPTPIQAQAIPHVAAGRDLVGCAQTGTGKTAAFALPILHRLTASGNPARGRGRRIRVLVLSPTRELATQIGASFAAYGRHSTLRHACIFGGVGQNPQVRALRHGIDILVATPGRLLDLMNQGFVDLSSVEIFVLDEADRMLDMGFMPDLKRIIAKLPCERQTVMFSATMPREIEKLANAILRDPVRITIAPVKATTDLIEQSVYHVPKQQKPLLLASFLAANPVSRAIVFTRTKHGADRVTADLNKSGVRAEAIHGNKSQNARQRTLANFKNNRMDVLVATDLAARGIDVDGVTHVINYDLPIEVETYVHRIGRTGRAGATGIAVSFCDGDERSQLRAIERLLRRELAVVRELPPGMPALAESRPAGPRGGNERDHGPAPSGVKQRKPFGRASGSKNRGRSRRRDGAQAERSRAGAARS